MGRYIHEEAARRVTEEAEMLKVSLSTSSLSKKK